MDRARLLGTAHLIHFETVEKFDVHNFLCPKTSVEFTFLGKGFKPVINTKLRFVILPLELTLFFYTL